MPRGEGQAVEGTPAPCPGPHLPAEVHLVQQLDPQKDADLVKLLGHVQVLLQVSLHQGIQHPPINQVVLEGLGVLGQADVIQPGLGHPVMVQLGSFGQAEEETQPENGWVGKGSRNKGTGRDGWRCRERKSNGVGGVPRDPQRQTWTGMEPRDQEGKRIKKRDRKSRDGGRGGWRRETEREKETQKERIKRERDREEERETLRERSRGR